MATTLPATLTVSEFKRRLDREGSDDDDLLTAYLTAAFRRVQNAPPEGTGRLLVPTGAGTELTLTIRGRQVMLPDASAIDSVVVDGTGVTEYEPLVLHGHIVRVTLPRETDWDTPDCDADRTRRREVRVTGAFGFDEIPEDLVEAIYVLAARAYYERASQYADHVAVGEGASAQAYFRQLPASAKATLQSYTVPRSLTGLA